jgi:hypothetical protein
MSTWVSAALTFRNTSAQPRRHFVFWASRDVSSACVAGTRQSQVVPSFGRCLRRLRTQRSESHCRAGWLRFRRSTPKRGRDNDNVVDSGDHGQPDHCRYRRRKAFRGITSGSPVCHSPRCEANLRDPANQLQRGGGVRGARILCSPRSTRVRCSGGMRPGVRRSNLCFPGRRESGDLLSADGLPPSRRLRRLRRVSVWLRHGIGM